MGSPSLFSDSFSLSPSFPFSSSFLGASLVFSFASSSRAPTPSRGSWSPRERKIEGTRVGGFSHKGPDWELNLHLLLGR